MRVFVISYKRSDRMLTCQNTLDSFNDRILRDTTIVVREEEKEAYEKVAKVYGASIDIIPEETYRSVTFFGWGETMDFVLSKYAPSIERFIICDDDLRLTFRKDLTVNKLTKMSLDEEQCERMIAYLLDSSNEAPLKGIIKRGFCMNFQEPEIVDVQINAMFGFFSPFFLNHPEMRFTTGNICHMPDRQLCLSLLTHGHHTRASCEFCFDDTPNAEGGCSLVRTPEGHSQSAMDLAKMFPGLVSLTQKTNLGDVRIGTVVNWKRAAEIGREHKEKGVRDDRH